MWMKMNGLDEKLNKQTNINNYTMFNTTNTQYDTHNAFLAKQHPNMNQSLFVMQMAPTTPIHVTRFHRI